MVERRGTQQCLLNSELEALLVDFRGDGLTTGRAAVLGSPISHSLSPVLHGAAYQSLGLTEWGFSREAVGGEGEPTLAQFLATCAGADEARAPWRGFAVTMPLKEDALALAVAVTERARRLGAANTLVAVPGGWAADNTDTVGVREALREVGVESAPRVVVLGSGATARSALGALSVLGARHVTFAVRSSVRPESETLARELDMEIETVSLGDADAVTEAIAQADASVSALPHGTTLHLPEVTAGRLGSAVLLDVVYGGWPSPLASWASAGGATVLSGLPMLLHQAVEQVRLMTGRVPDVGAMRSALQAHTGPSGW
ncbi:MAG: shikimate dehydrogenase [Dermatophilus congolensis]|nr:shikimate dehydrogenase [Dermatophilus congolensis]